MSSNLAEVWENVYKNNEWGKYPPECLIRFVANNYYKSTRNKIRFLEVGCGTGANIWYLTREGFEAYGIDISATAIERAKEWLEKEELEAHFLSGDIASLPYENEFFDCVIDNECLYCNSLEVTKNILREIKRVLKKEGLFFSRTISNEMYMGRSQKKISDCEFDEISDGPVAGKGFARVIDRQGISELYGGIFEIVSVDKIEYTFNNGADKVSEWLIVSRKEGDGRVTEGAMRE